MTLDTPRGHLFCSFCRKSDLEVKLLVGGPGVYICGACVRISLKILVGNFGKRAPEFAGWDSYTDSQLLASLAPSEMAVKRSSSIAAFRANAC